MRNQVMSGRDDNVTVTSWLWLLEQSRVQRELQFDYEKRKLTRQLFREQQHAEALYRGKDALIKRQSHIENQIRWFRENKSQREVMLHQNDDILARLQQDIHDAYDRRKTWLYQSDLLCWGVCNILFIGVYSYFATACDAKKDWRTWLTHSFVSVCRYVNDNTNLERYNNNNNNNNNHCSGGSLMRSNNECKFPRHLYGSPTSAAGMDYHYGSPVYGPLGLPWAWLYHQSRPTVAAVNELILTHVTGNWHYLVKLVNKSLYEMTIASMALPSAWQLYLSSASQSVSCSVTLILHLLLPFVIFKILMYFR
jgi:hypothetical protein